MGICISLARDLSGVFSMSQINVSKKTFTLQFKKPRRLVKREEIILSLFFCMESKVWGL
jgi:hypothetical protein